MIRNAFFWCAQMTWYPAYFLAACCVFQLILYCALGTVVEIAVSVLMSTEYVRQRWRFPYFVLVSSIEKNDRLEHAILQVDFYLLPLDLQRDYLFMINIVQKAKRLKTAKTELDVKLFVSVVIHIYHDFEDKMKFSIYFDLLDISISTGNAENLRIHHVSPNHDLNERILIGSFDDGESNMEYFHFEFETFNCFSK